jgi:hypothetical protein
MIAPARQVDPQRAAVALSLNGPLASLGNVGVPDARRPAQGRPSTKAEDVEIVKSAPSTLASRALAARSRATLSPRPPQLSG